MENKTIRTSIITAVLTGAIGLAVVGGGVVRLDLVEGSRWLTKSQYGELRTEIIEKYRGKNLTWQEFQLFTAVLDKEVKGRKGMELQDITKENLIDKIIEEINK